MSPSTSLGGWDKAAHAELRYMMNCAHARRGIYINRGIRHWKKFLTFAHFRGQDNIHGRQFHFLITGVEPNYEHKAYELYAPLV